MEPEIELTGRSSAIKVPWMALALSISLLLAQCVTSRASSQEVHTSAQEASPQLGAITPYIGLGIDAIEFPGVAADDVPSLISSTTLKLGEPLTRDNLHDAMKALFATGRFSDIQAEVNRTNTAGVRLRFLTTANSPRVCSA